MKVLWITNTLFPEASQLLLGKGESRGSGGWMFASAEYLVKQPELYLYVACTSPLVNELVCLNGKRIVYYVLPLGKGNKQYNSEYEKYWIQIKKSIDPDIVHIHGTEFTHGLAYVKACGSDNVVVSIQGMKSVIADYYTAGMSWKEIISHLTIRDIIKGGIYTEQREFRRTGVLEKELIKSVKHVIGRTGWDKAHTWSINPNIQYHFCNESLRPEFMDGSCWSYQNCIKNSIFISNAIYPLKGFHQLIKAMPLILQQYPDAQIRVAGNNVLKYSGINALRHETTYWNYLKDLIRKYKLQDKVVFTGSLNAEQMKQEYLKSNVFVCPSSIENSPNSIGEAQVLGVPCVASFVGGISDMMNGCEDFLFRFEDEKMLAAKIRDVFNNSSLNMEVRDIAFHRHDAKENQRVLNQIYIKIHSNI